MNNRAVLADSGIASLDPPAPPARRLPAEAAMTLGGLLLGSIGVFLVEAGQPPATAVWFRCVFGGLALTAWLAGTGSLGALRMGWRASGFAVLAGGLMVFNWALFFAAIDRLSIGLATVLFNLQPFWVMALGVILLGERSSARQWGAAAVALAGLALASGLAPGGGGAGMAQDGTAWIGVAMCLGGSLSYALVTVIGRRHLHAGPLAQAWWQCMVGAVVLAPWIVVDGLPAWGAAWGWLAGLGVIHTGLAYGLLYAGVARLPPGRAGLLQFVYPATAIGLDWLVYGHTLDGLQSIGVLLMAAALLAGLRPAPRG